MLSIQKIGSTNQGLYYARLAADDYYHQGGEPPGRWHGAGARALGLDGEVALEDFAMLLRGSTPGGNTLVQNAGQLRHQPGWDLTLSCPKSVSVLWAVADPTLRARIEATQEDAVRATLSALEDMYLWTRRGKGGVRREPAGLVAAQFVHGTSRAQEPQLHCHTVVLNIGVRADGTTGTIESKPFYRAKMALGALFRLELSYRLEHDLGVRLDRTQDGFSVRHVPEGLVRAFSTRRKQIEAFLKESGYASSRAAEKAALATRDRKMNRPHEELLAAWRDTARGYGMTPEYAEALIDHAPPLRALRNRGPRLVKAACERLIGEQGHFSQTELLRVVAESALLRGGDAAALQATVGRALAAPDMVCLGVVGGEARYTTRAALAREERMLEHAILRNQSDRGGIAGPDSATLTKRYPTLSDEQRTALRHITTESAPIALVSGRAGTGKTALLRAAREVWEKAGYRVYGAALAGKAARGLEVEAGIPSETLASRFRQLDVSVWKAAGHHLRQIVRAARGKRTYTREELTLTKKCVLVVDEAAMVGTGQMAALLDICHSTGARLVLVGDAGQLQSIEAGGAFQALCDRLGCARLGEIRRQRDAWARQAVRDIADGKGREALRAFVARGLCQIAPDEEQARSRLLSDWQRHRTRDLKETLVLTARREDARTLNARLQEMRREAGELGFRYLTLKERGDSERLYEGDRVLFTRNAKVYGVQNGTLGTVLRIEALSRRLHIRLDSGERRTIDLKCYSDLTLGYAMTTFKAQGVTVDKAFVLMGGPQQDQELSYVQLSRARGESRLYAVAGTLEAGIEMLIEQTERSRQKRLAVDIAREATPEPVLEL